jgi:hypothetical protein
MGSMSEASSELADALMTARREERKYLLEPSHARRLVAALGQRLSPHRFNGEGANRLPDARHHVTTIYFDTPSRDLYAAARGASDSLKLRAKEYYDLHPKLTEVATDPRQLVRFRPVLFLEIKHKEGSFTGKRRIGIPKHDVPEFFAGGRITAEMIQLQERAFGRDAESVMTEVAALCRRFAEPLGADCLVHYRRSAWQDEAGTLRVTLDRALSFFAPPADLWTRDFALLGETLGVARATEPRLVLEVKSRVAEPAWLAQLLGELGAAAQPFSKFEAASRAVHG